jgi:hypothetical protein
MNCQSSSIENNYNEHLFYSGIGVIMLIFTIFSRDKWIKLQVYLDNKAKERLQRDYS